MPFNRYNNSLSIYLYINIKKSKHVKVGKKEQIHSAVHFSGRFSSPALQSFCLYQTFIHSCHDKSSSSWEKNIAQRCFKKQEMRAMLPSIANHMGKLPDKEWHNTYNNFIIINLVYFLEFVDAIKISLNHLHIFIIAYFRCILVYLI